MRRLSPAGFSALFLLALSCTDRSVPLTESGPADGQLTDGPGAEATRADSAADDGSAGDGGWSLVCDPAQVSCKALPGPCPVGEVRAVIGDCWGDCQPIDWCDDVPTLPNCDRSAFSCSVPPPACPLGYVVTVPSSGCYGPCVPATTCSCTASGPSSQCPENHTCHNYLGRCGPFL